MANRVKAPEKISEDRKIAADEQIVELSKRIEFFITEYSVEMLADKMKNGEFVVPNYQRNFTWDHERKTRFIESLLLGLPIPFLFFWEMPDGKFEIVDGSQRLRTMQEFIHAGYVLGPMDSLTACEGFSFDDFPDPRRRKIKNRSVRGIVLNEHADEQARFDLFDRINTGSLTAGSAEVRRGALAGPFMQMITDLADDLAFKNLAPVPKKAEDMREREELVTRFFGYGDGTEAYRDRPREFLFNYVKAMNERFSADPQLRDQYVQRFQAMLEVVGRVFPIGFRKTAKATSTPRARFEAISIGAALALDQRPELLVGPLPSTEWAHEGEFLAVTGADGANARARLNGRIEYVRAKLVGAV
ncbi:DUF262 domain-containing protein [Stenotrophomonas sp.]|uniref:DUF262 domain-containing protein n=1 Tax=Stenotrophomonas sp. TaxID=69392 RepID=UPI0019A4BDA3|nr:DUF262 domain-containing protein [Stenotrophomonas sp.]MBD3826152.1 DUF262 domain-containing protein [Stenotrophomonas sp.]